MESTATNDGRYALVVTFEVGTDPDEAQVLVQNRVSAALASLPSAVQEQGVVTEKKSTSILQIVTLTSKNDEFDALFLSNYATINLHDELAKLTGVGDVLVFGIGEYSNAHLAESGRDAGPLPDARRCYQRHPGAEPGSLGRPDRYAAGAGRPGLPDYS